MAGDTDAIQHAAELIAQADGLLVTAGAGMGVDSGLPDFRGPQGFWKAYPALGRRAIGFEEIANPAHFQSSPRLAWGFYGHRLTLYRRTRPHAGFAILQRWAERMPHGAGVFTSNVDGQFQAAGFGAMPLAECHGSIHHLQCSEPCSEAIWPAQGFEPEIDEEQGLLANDPPRCPDCGAVARPNILMFGDQAWLPRRSQDQEVRLRRWLDRCDRLVVVELGAGSRIPSVRRFSHAAIIDRQAVLVRINPDAPDVPRGVDVSIAGRALAALQAIDEAIALN